MPRRKRLPVAVPNAARPSTPIFAPQLIPFGEPHLDAALGGGLPLGRLTEIIGATEQGKHLLAARFIAARQQRAPAVRIVWLDLSHRLDLELVQAVGVDLHQVTVLAPRDGSDTLRRAFTYLAAHPAHILVISGLPALSRRDLLFIGLLERLAILVPGTRTILLCLTAPETTGSALARLAAVRLQLDHETISTAPGRTRYTAALTVLKHRVAARQPGWHPGAQVALRLIARAPGTAQH
jgi:hypothetical protein